MRFFSRKGILLLPLFASLLSESNAQRGTVNYDYGGVNTVFTAVPFLRINPDARNGGMGDMGVALSPEPASMSFNESALAFAEHDFAVTASYVPWLRSIGINDIYMAHIAGYKKIDKLQTVGASIRYFSLGEINFTDYNGQSLGSDKPNEFEINAAYARKLSKNFSAGLGLKFIYSKLANGTYNGGLTISPGTAVAADITMTYRQPIKVNDKTSELTVGLALTNVGSKISYTQGPDSKDFIPQNFSLGGAWRFDFDKHNSLTTALEINKLLVPTPQPKSLGTDAQGHDIPNPNYDTNNNNIADYREVSPIAAIFSSWGDAPGGFSEELREINIIGGLEYWYDKQFAVRAGYFYEDATKGARQYATVGLGLRYSMLTLNFAYLIPSFNTNAARSPLDNTLRFSLMFTSFGEDDKKNSADKMD